MTRDFASLVTAAKRNDEKALARLLALYDPLLESQSRINGIRDEDLKQHLSMRFIVAVKKFELRV